MSYVDGFVIPVPKKNFAAYKKMARLCAKIWTEHGATGYVETVAEDVKPGKLTSFPQAVKLKQGEVVIFSWIVYKSRSHRDRVMKAVFADPRMQNLMGPRKKLPFDGKRMIVGGFKVFLEG